MYNKEICSIPFLNLPKWVQNLATYFINSQYVTKDFSQSGDISPNLVTLNSLTNSQKKFLNNCSQNYVRMNHGNVYRRTILCAMIDSTKNICKTQCKVEPRDATK